MKSLEEIRDIFKECYLGSVFAKAETSYIKKHLFIRIYGHYPYVFSMTNQTNKEGNDEEELYMSSYKSIDENSIYNVNISDTRKNIKNIPNTINMNGIIFGENFMFDPSYSQILTLENKLPKEVEDALVINNRENKIKYVYKTNYGYETKLLDVKSQNIDIKTNYNDNLPHTEITDFINSKDSGISILYGEAGTGKTSYIRHLIDKNPHKEFYWMDQSAFYEMNSADFIEFLCDMKNSIIILEDCEVILKSREDGMNSVLSAILNLSDGILGDSLNIKFICTFNTSLNKIDKALLRKGRLKMQYEFKKLSKEKVQHLFEILGIPGEAKEELPLCEVYNFLKHNKVEEDKPKKIGF